MYLSEGTISADHAEDFRRCVKLSHIYYTYATFRMLMKDFISLINLPLLLSATLIFFRK
jgi:hypothetical protein